MKPTPSFHVKLHLSILLLLIPLAMQAAVKEFRVSSSKLEAVPAGTPQATLIVKLKQLAVSEYLRSLPGSKSAEYQDLVTPDFAERFVIEYRVNRTGGSEIELVGKMDIGALREWVQLNEAKGGSGFKPAFLFSSSLPGFTFGPKESAKRIKESTVGQAVLSQISPVLQRFNVKYLIPSDLSTSLASPARGDDELRSLRSAVSNGGLNGAVWAHLSPCPGCGTKLDVYVYDLSRPRLLWGRSDEMKLEPRDFSNTERVKKIVRDTLKDFAGDFEDVLSSGLMTSHPLRLVVEDVDDYRLFKALKTALSQLEYSVRALVKRSANRTAEFEMMTTLSTDEFRKRLQQEEFRGFRLTVKSADSDGIVAKLSKL